MDTSRNSLSPGSPLIGDVHFYFGHVAPHGLGCSCHQWLLQFERIMNLWRQVIAEIIYAVWVI